MCSECAGYFGSRLGVARRFALCQGCLGDRNFRAALASVLDV